MAVEKYTENLTLKEMKCDIGDNGWGYVFPQGDIGNADKIHKLLAKAGGKPITCALDDFTSGGNGKAQPEFIITFNDDANIIVVVECKNSVKKHATENLNCPKGFAVDGVLYYAKFLKEDYNVIAVAVSGTKSYEIKVDAFYWQRGFDVYTSLHKAKDIILEPVNYRNLVQGKKLEKELSLDKIRETAIDMHDYLRELAVREEHKPIFIAGVLIALNNEDFSKTYWVAPSFDKIMSDIQHAIEEELKKGGIRNDRTAYIKNIFAILKDNKKFASIPIIERKSIRLYVEQLEIKIKPMMDYADSTLDALGVFYHEFIKYSGGDGSGLGIVLTPGHLTEFMCELANVGKNSKVIDICCGSGSFLVTAMSKMFKDANPQEIEKIRKKSLYGVEQDDGLYTLAIANMIIRQDGKSNIIKGDCFDIKIFEELKKINPNIGLINPPYSLKGGKVELEFVEQLLSVLAVGGTGVVVVPMSCAIGTKFKEVRERLFKKHTLKAVFSMPDDIFYPIGTNPCVMVWEAHTSHDSTRETFFGYCKDDGFVKRKKLGRIDYYGKWQDKKDKYGKVLEQGILSQWLKLYRNRIVKVGLSAMQCVTHKDEWLCEAYMNTDYSLLTQDDFQKTVNDYLAYLVRNSLTCLSINFSEIKPIKINTQNWKEFKIGDFFVIKRGKRIVRDRDYFMQPTEEYKYNVITSTKQNNSVDGYYHSFNCLANSIVCGGEAGGMFTTYQPTECWVMDRARIFIPKNGVIINKYTALFLATIFGQNQYKYSYGRTPNPSGIETTIIKLPIKNNSPDWSYMEKYIKSLLYGDRI